MVEYLEPRVAGRSASGLTVTAFGTFECRVAGEPVTRWGAGRSRALLQYLVVQHGRHASRAGLSAALWPDSEPARAANSLKVAVHALRRVLRPADGVRVGFTGDGYALTGDVWSDVDELVTLGHRARAAEHADRLPAAAACSVRAAALHRGGFLPGEQAEWARDARTWARLEVLYVHDVARRMALRHGSPDVVRAAANSALEADRCHEPAYQAIMWLHARRGERAAVDTWFRRCRRRLRADLDLAPDSVTTRLHAEAMCGDRSRTPPVTLLTG